MVLPVLKASVPLTAIAALALSCSRPAPPTPSAKPVEPVTSAAASTASAKASEAAPASAASASAPRATRLAGPASEVREEDGKIVVADAEGHLAELTKTGLDTSPVLSPDGRSVLFLRRLAEDDSGYRRDLYLVRVDGSPPERLVKDDVEHPLKDQDSPRQTQLFHPEFFPDGRRATISVPNGRGEAILSVDLQTRKVTWLASGFGYEHVLVPRGPHAGDLVLTKHRYSDSPEGGSYDECVLVDGRTGKQKLNLTSDDFDCDDTPKLRARLAY